MSRVNLFGPFAGAATIVGWLLSALGSPACNVPVFRYALERWQPAPYEAVVFHRGPLPPELQATVAALEQPDPQPPANLFVRKVDLDGTLDAPTQKLWQQQTNATLPWVVLRYASGWGDAPVIWAGTLARNLAERLTVSPARREIARRLLQGQTAVWVLLESGRPPVDEAALDLLTDALKTLQKELEFPEPAPDDPQMHSPLPLRVDFGIVRVARNNPAEDLFLKILTRGNEELAASTLPIAFPVFGRGRILAALTDKELCAEIIADACAFLCGPCSCEIKELNPGWDMLLAANWDAVFEEGMLTEPAAPELTGLTSPAPPATNEAATNLALVATGTQAGGGNLPRNVLLVFGFVAVVLVAGTFVLRGKAAKTQN